MGTTGKQQDLIYKYSLNFAHLLCVGISLPTVMEDLFYDFCEDCDEKTAKPLSETFWCLPQVYVVLQAKFRMPCYEDLAHEFRTASSPGGRVVPVVSCTLSHLVICKKLQNLARNFRTFDSIKKFTQNGQDNSTVKVIAIHTDLIDYWLF